MQTSCVTLFALQSASSAFASETGTILSTSPWRINTGGRVVTSLWSTSGRPPKYSTTAETRGSYTDSDSDKYDPSENPSRPTRAGSTFGCLTAFETPSATAFIQAGKLAFIVARSATF